MTNPLVRPMLLILSLAACSSGSKEDTIPSKVHPFVQLSDPVGSGELRIVEVALDDCALKVGLGPADQLNVQQTSCDREELDRGRSLFDEPSLAAYRAAGASAGADGAMTTRATGPRVVVWKGRESHGFSFGTAVSDKPLEMLQFLRTLHARYYTR